MTTNNNQRPGLPVRGGLSVYYLASILILLLMGAISLSGIFMTDSLYPSEELVQNFLPTDIVNLVVGVPILLGSLWWARRGSLAGLLCWPGALFFVLYNTIAYVYAVPLSWALLVYLLLAMLSLYTLVGLTAQIDSHLVRERLSGRVPEKFAGGVLAAFGLLFLLRVFMVSAEAINGGNSLSRIEYAANLSDFFTSPAFLIGGILLWKKKAFGYLTGLGLLFQASMLFIALMVFLVLQPLLTNALFSFVDLVVVFVMGLVCFVPFGLYLRGAMGSQEHRG